MIFYVNNGHIILKKGRGVFFVCVCMGGGSIYDPQIDGGDPLSPCRKNPDAIHKIV